MLNQLRWFLTELEKDINSFDSTVILGGSGDIPRGRKRKCHEVQGEIVDLAEKVLHEQILHNPFIRSCSFVHPKPPAR